MVENKTFNFATVLQALRRRHKIFAVAFAALFLISLGVILTLKPVYQSSATILIEQQEIPKELVRSTVTSYAEQRVAVISQRVMTTPNLMAVAVKYNLYEEARKTASATAVAEAMRQKINRETISAEVVDPRTGRPTVATIAFRLSFEDHSPEIAQRIANELTTLYINENLRNRTEMAQQAGQFLFEEAEKLSKKLAELESSIAQFKKDNFKALPEHHELNIRRLEQAKNEYDDVQRELRMLAERRVYVESQLLTVTPNANVIGESGQSALSASGRLKLAQSQYLQKKDVYSPQHPEIKRLLKEIASAQAALGMDNGLQLAQKELLLAISQQEAAAAKYTQEHPTVKRLDKQVDEAYKKVAQLAAKQRDDKKRLVDQAIKADNPVYIQLQTNLKSIKAEEGSLRAKSQELKVKIADYQDINQFAPEVERKYRDILRDYENTSRKYTEVKAKQLEADLAKSLESEQKGERFTLIEPPVRPIEPHKPNRKLLVLVSFVFCMMLALGLVVIAEMLDNKIYRADRLQQLVGMPALAEIPYIKTEEDHVRRKQYRIAYAIAGAILLVIIVLAYHFMVTPLDVAWYSNVDKVGA